MANTEDLARAVGTGDRRALARAITLVESTRAADRQAAELLLTHLLALAGSALRIGISGAPGVGKSTFIEALGAAITDAGLTLAVLAVDPSSTRSGGSILGDKTRMEQLARNPRAFVRPSPSGAMLGGVARRTREAILLVEAAGFDIVLVETVGVGQSDTAVSEMVDMFVLLVAPGGGDDLQGIKRGVMELADAVIVTKADGDLKPAAARAASDFQAALHVMRPKYPGITAGVTQVSALTGENIAACWQDLQRFLHQLQAGGHREALRRGQGLRWFRSEIQALLGEAIASDPAIARELAQLEEGVARGDALPYTTARRLISRFLSLDGREAPP
ncbi:MAG TPA: methylmalonyl Co-A mutase-associated GTPase MeaB [Rhizomicrobium sp.]|jgi:LAO/AO transport system kinase